MEERVSDFISLKKKESMLKRLGEDKSLPCYAPFGEDGPQVSMISCIQIINRLELYLIFYKRLGNEQNFCKIYYL